MEAAADCLPGGGGGGEDDITQEGRVMLTDHGSFVLLNIYAPNAGEKPLKPRLEFKMRFLNALRSKCELHQATQSPLFSYTLKFFVEAVSTSLQVSHWKSPRSSVTFLFLSLLLSFMLAVVNAAFSCLLLCDLCTVICFSDREECFPNKESILPSHDNPPLFLVVSSVQCWEGMGLFNIPCR